MKLDAYQAWLCGDRWNGYALDKMLVDSSKHFTALRSLSIINSGLMGEAGEAGEHIKKWMRDQRINRRAAAIELGDNLAYLTWLAKVLGYSLEDIAELNFEKLRDAPPKQATGGSSKPEIT